MATLENTYEVAASASGLKKLGKATVKDATMDGVKKIFEKA